MDNRLKELRSELAGKRDVMILKEQRWQLPVLLYDVSYGRVKRLKMDILMKMLLLAFQETTIRRAGALADMLFVEELFIRDLIEKMERTRLIRLNQKGYELTDKGYAYLEQGIFEEEMEAEEALVSYSAVHDNYLLTDSEEEARAENELPLYRYAAGRKADTKRMQEFLAEELNETEDSYQVLITDILKSGQRSTEFIPCFEFQLYDRKQDIFYARVWNGLTGSWDEILEKQIEEHEVVQWREKMKTEIQNRKKDEKVKTPAVE